LRAHGEQVVFVKRANERREHVLMKAILWALYLPADSAERFVRDRGEIKVTHADLDLIRLS
jgi:hypothetical protein